MPDDLRVRIADHREPLLSFLRGELARFVDLYPEDAVSTACLYSMQGSHLLSFDTPESSARYVASEKPRGFGSYGRDDLGEYCDNPCDFPYHCWTGSGTHPLLAEVYDGSAGDLTIEWPDGAMDAVRIDGRTDREASVRAQDRLPAFLIDVMGELERCPELARLRRAEPFRLGVEVHDRDAQFWPIGSGARWRAGTYGWTRVV